MNARLGTMPAAARPDSAAILERLVAFDTTSHLSNLALIDYIEAYLGEYGIVAERDYNAERTKANLYATIGEGENGGLLLSGHTDVVPVADQEWTSDPFVLTHREGRLYGRGTCDMKGFLACVLAAVPRMSAARLSMPIHLAFSYDEEVGCTGVRSLVEKIAARPRRPAMCIVGEPTSMQVVIAHKGRQSFHVTATGTELHSSFAPDGVNAIEAASRLVNFISDIAGRKQVQGPRDDDFDVPVTTLVTGLIRGGTGLNILPGQCVFDFEIRDMPPDDPKALRGEIETFAYSELLPRMRAISPGAGLEIELLAERPALDTPPDAPVVRFVQQLLGRNGHAKVSFGTEASHFHSAGIPTVVCGPGDIARAHKADEYIEEAELAQCDAFLTRILDRLEGDAR